MSVFYDENAVQHDDPDHSDEEKDRFLMKIPAYQIHNVLMAYSRQLQERIANKKEDRNTNSMCPTITNSGKHKAILRKVMSDIFDKVSFLKECEENLYKQSSLIEWKSEVAAVRKNGFIKQKQFTYIRYDNKNQKSVEVLNIE